VHVTEHSAKGHMSVLYVCKDDDYGRITPTCVAVDFQGGSHQHLECQREVSRFDSDVCVMHSV
jgi:hypothetical protein